MKKQNRVLKEFKKLTNDQKEDALDFMQYLLFKRNIVKVTNKYGNTYRYLSLNIFR